MCVNYPKHSDSQTVGSVWTKAALDLASDRSTAEMEMDASSGQPQERS